jgi:hypothetical protein
MFSQLTMDVSPSFEQLSYLIAQLRFGSTPLPSRPIRQRNMYGTIGERDLGVMMEHSPLEATRRTPVPLDPFTRKPEWVRKQSSVSLAFSSTPGGTQDGSIWDKLCTEEWFMCPSGGSVASSTSISEHCSPVARPQTHQANHILAPVPVRLGTHRAAVRAWEAKIMADSSGQTLNQQTGPSYQSPGALGLDRPSVQESHSLQQNP